MCREENVHRRESRKPKRDLKPKKCRCRWKAVESAWKRSRFSLHLHSLLFFRQATTREVEESTQCTVSSMPAFHFDSFLSGNWRKLQTRIKTMQKRQPHGKILITRRLALHLFLLGGFPPPLMKISRLTCSVPENVPQRRRFESPTRLEESINHRPECVLSTSTTRLTERMIFHAHHYAPENVLKVSRICRLKPLMRARNTFAVVALDKRFHPSFRFERQPSWC